MLTLKKIHICLYTCVAHKTILAARCDPLAVMLVGPMREATMTEITIPDQQVILYINMLLNYR